MMKYNLRYNIGIISIKCYSKVLTRRISLNIFLSESFFLLVKENKLANNIINIGRIKLALN